jgi:putative Mg2+ transporter-C (MgtC) family protein
MFDELQEADIYKVIFSLVAGILLGMERELKDKAAGVKTISIICLGATLFSIVSLRFDPDRATALAAYIVSGVGFLGAGVIFKDGVNISGLTTASIIWMAAAVGTSIGFGEFYLAGCFLFASFLVIWVTPVLNRVVASKKQSKILTIRFQKQDYLENDVISTLRSNCFKVSTEKITFEDDMVEMIVDIVIKKTQAAWVAEYLLAHPKVVSFTL